MNREQNQTKDQEEMEKKIGHDWFYLLVGSHEQRLEEIQEEFDEYNERQETIRYLHEKEEERDKEEHNHMFFDTLMKIATKQIPIEKQAEYIQQKYNEITERKMMRIFQEDY